MPILPLTKCVIGQIEERVDLFLLRLVQKRTVDPFATHIQTSILAQKLPFPGTPKFKFGQFIPPWPDPP